MRVPSSRSTQVDSSSLDASSCGSNAGCGGRARRLRSPRRTVPRMAGCSPEGAPTTAHAPAASAHPSADGCSAAPPCPCLPARTRPCWCCAAAGWARTHTRSTGRPAGWGKNAGMSPAMMRCWGRLQARMPRQGTHKRRPLRVACGQRLPARRRRGRRLARLVKVQHHRVAQQPERAAPQAAPQVAGRQPQCRLVSPLQPAPLDGRLDALHPGRAP